MLRSEHFSQRYLDMLRDPIVRPVAEHGMLLVRSHSCAGDGDFPFVFFFTSFDETGGAVALFYICSNQTTSQSVMKELKIVKVISEGC